MTSKNKPVAKTVQTEMDKMLASNGHMDKLPAIGDSVKGTVISASKKEVRLDVDGLLMGIVRGRELYPEAASFSNLKVGDEVEATVIDLENEQGVLELSFRHAGAQKTWSTLRAYQTENQTVQAVVKDANKGGLLVMLGNVPGFLPVSQLSPEYYPRVQGGDKMKILERLKSYVNKTFSVKVIDVRESEEKLIVSEKAAWEETQKDTISQYKVNDIVEGKISAITDFGVFLEFGPKMEGLIHISELAWQRIENPFELYKVGQEMKAEIIKIEGAKIFLSSKKLTDDPWKNITDKFKVNEEVEGVVLKTSPFGLFVELDKDIHGLCHISELSDEPVKSVNDLAKVGDKMKFKIISLEPTEHRLGLSLKTVGKEEAKKE